MGNSRDRIMDGLQFITPLGTPASDASRVDVACFIGLVARRGDVRAQPGETPRARLQRVIPSGILEWLQIRRWVRFETVSTAEEIVARNSHRTLEQLAELEDVPIPIESWDVFDELFDWDNRGLEQEDSPRRAGTRLGAAVREFFANGGRQAYVIRAGNPTALLAQRRVRLALLARLIPDLILRLGARANSFGDAELFGWRTSAIPLSPVDIGTWRGVGHLFGLPEVSFLGLPDLPDLLAADLPAFLPSMPPLGPETFVETDGIRPDIDTAGLRALPVPRCDAEGYPQWATVVQVLGEFLSDRRNRLREIQFVGAVPLPIRESDWALGSSLAEPAERVRAVFPRVQAAKQAQWVAAGSVQSAFVQLVYPWLRLVDSARLPGGLSAPDGFWIGLLAANALGQGTWRNLQRTELPTVLAVEPVVDPSTQRRPLPFNGTSLNAPRTLRERISLLGPSAGTLRVLSDVTTDDNETYRQAHVNRLIAALMRATRMTGEALVFRNNGPQLWREVEDSLRTTLEALWAEGALDGANPREAFSVRCDRSTMSQADLDAGRLIAQLILQPASTIERIEIVLALDDGGQISLVGVRPDASRREAA